ncbi:MAG: choice-of-anchor Q domain-containing protein [Chitinophagaceae bacterium]
MNAISKSFYRLTCLVACCTFLWFLLSCSKTGFNNSPDARVNFSTDTLRFDTVFTSVGSVTQSFKIRNDNDQKLKLSTVRLMGGNSSAYRINIDGAAVAEANNIELAPNDSIYVFVQVTVDPTTANLPFIIQDSVQIIYNGNERFVQLESWGQNAHFLRNKTVTLNETWNNDLPYVVQGFLYVDEGVSLTINKGCRIYLHADAPVVVEGSLITQGERDTADRVYFSGDRLDVPYRNFPASWPGIYFTPLSFNNSLRYTVISNAYQALIVEAPSLNANPKLRLNECVIDNAFDAGILATNSSITATNCLISNCGRNISLTGGGAYQFTHCTAATYSSTYINHKEPVLAVSNTFNNNVAALQATFTNCIFWGEGGLVDDEVIVSRTGSTPFSVNFGHSLWKVANTPANVTLNQMINGQNPLFDSINTGTRYYNFRLKAESPAIGKGTAAGVATDLDGKARPATLPDPGCFEY